MARTKSAFLNPRAKWTAHRYRDHASLPAILMAKRPTNLQSMIVLPEFAIQVYSTVPLDLESEHETIALCNYLASGTDSYPSSSFEIYGSQPDVFACVEHQRREIFHRKKNSPGEGFFPGVAKVAPSSKDRLLQGFLLVITSYSFRTTDRPDYEGESGPLWVTFNRSFPLKAKVDLYSRVEGVAPFEFDPSTFRGECAVYSEREELVVRKCRDVYEKFRELPRLLVLSQCGNSDYHFDYGLDDDEGDPSLIDQPLEIIESLQSKANSFRHEDFDVQSSEGTVVITSNPITTSPEPDLRYIIYITFPHPQLALNLMPIAQAFTTMIVDNLPPEKTVSFEFHSATQSQGLGAILASHRDLMKSRPELAIGATHQGHGSFPQDRDENYIQMTREPYRTFFVILDRLDSLTASGVLFFLTDGNEITDEAMQMYPLCRPRDQLGNYTVYQVWRSAGMAEVAQRLAMIPSHTFIVDQ
ncbi:hypothetical protein N7494_000974 [Penicillium frequentans]|uniref:Uncharacterized protein n=1 Tax=Penicillium frequentans TaxID=3151616 RepID=A0AAD6GJG3_9EURO|nr:hypothetical protein N7494_000974 [Penicillium glabrum]